MSGGGGARVSIAGGLKKTIQDIREIAGEHSDEDIFAMLKECSMDPNETAQRLLHLDTFHEVKKKHGKRKENVVVKAAEIPGKQRGARVGRGAKVGGGNFHSQNTSQTSARGNFGGSKENGFANVSKGYKSEYKVAPESSRLVRVESNEKSIQDEAPKANLKADELYVPADGDKPSALKYTPARISAKQEKDSSIKNHVVSAARIVQLHPLASMSTETVDIEVIAFGNSVHETHRAMSNGNTDRSIDEIQNGVPHTEIVDTAKSQPTALNSNGQTCQAKGVATNGTAVSAEKQPISEVDISVLKEETSKLVVSDATDGHVVFPEHLHVPEAYKKKLTFGSFCNSWPLDVKHASQDCSVSTDMLIPADDSYLVNTITKPAIESNGSMPSTVKDAQERENTHNIQSQLPLSNNTPLIFEHASSDVVIKIDDPEEESLVHNGGPDIAYHPSDQNFGYAPKPLFQAHDSAEPQQYSTPSTSGVDRNGNTQLQPPGATHDTLSSPPPGHFLRQSYHPNCFPYGHYYPQLFLPQVQQYVAHGGFPQQPLMPNLYLASPAAGGIKYPHQQQKQGLNAGSDSYTGVPSGYNPYAFPYALPPSVSPGNVVGGDDRATQAKENGALTIEQQTESSGEWIAGTGRTVPGMHINPYYSIPTGQGHPMVFPPTPTGFGPFGGVYHHPSSVQTIPAPQPAVHPQHNQQTH